MFLYLLISLGPGQQLRAELPASAVTQALLPVCAGIHWSAQALVLHAETHPVWDQLRAVPLLPAEQNRGGSGGLPLHPPWREPDAVPGSQPAEAGHLSLHAGTGGPDKLTM